MTRNLFRKLVFSGFVSLFFLSTNAAQAFSQSDLIAEGNVLGYASDMGGEIKSFGMFVLPAYPAFIKITKVSEGEEKSQYIIVLLKSSDRDYAEKNFGINKISRFKLVRRTNYFLKVKDLFRTGFVMKDGKLERMQKFTFVPEANKKDLPLDKKIPVYAELERNS